MIYCKPLGLYGRAYLLGDEGLAIADVRDSEKILPQHGRHSGAGAGAGVGMGVAMYAGQREGMGGG
jgi:hypothetical protein